MSTFPYRLCGPIGSLATFGLVTLQTDETIEQDFRRMFAHPEIALHVTRVASGAELTPESIAAMEEELPRAAALLPAAARFDAVAYACTSGTALIGASRVAALLGRAVETRAVTDPLTAVLAAARALGLSRLALVSPYVPPVAGPIREALEAAGFGVPVTLSFGEALEARVARIDPASILEAVLEAGRHPGVDGVFVSCTNLRALDILDRAEAAIGRPVVCSNQALGWHMARLAGIEVPGFRPGRLFALPVDPPASRRPRR